MINIFCNNKKCFKREAFVENRGLSFFAICNFELLAAESFSDVFCKNLFGTTPFLMQFKSALVSNKAMGSSLKSSEKIRVILIKYFLEDICVNTFRKSSRICSIFVSVCGNA